MDRADSWTTQRRAKGEGEINFNIHAPLLASCTSEHTRMSGFRFFEEYTDEARAESTGNVIAVQLGLGSFVQPGRICFQAVCAPAEARIPNSVVTTTYFNVEYLGKNCRRVSEARARFIHPRLFEYLDLLS